MSEYTEYYVIPTPSIDTVRERLIANRIRSCIDLWEEERAIWDTLPEHRRFLVVLTLDATVEKLGELFGRALWLEVHQDRARWRLRLWVGGRKTRFIFGDSPDWAADEEDAEQVFIASRTPSEQQIVMVEEFFSVPRTVFLQHLRWGGLKYFARATGMPLHFIADQRCLQWCYEYGLNEKIVIPYDELD